MIGMFYGMYGAASSHASARQSAASAGRSQHAAAEVVREIKVLTERLDKLVLINMAMWSLIQDKAGLSEEDLIQRAQEIDLRDGVADGKVTRKVKTCGHCGRTISKRHSKCLFCGSEALGETPFDKV